MQKLFRWVMWLYSGFVPFNPLLLNCDNFAPLLIGNGSNTQEDNPSTRGPSLLHPGSEVMVSFWSVEGNHMDGRMDGGRENIQTPQSWNQNPEAFCLRWLI